MNGLNRTLRWFTAVVCVVAMSAVPALADLKKKDPKMTPATDKNTAVPAVPRAIPHAHTVLGIRSTGQFAV